MRNILVYAIQTTLSQLRNHVGVMFSIRHMLEVATPNRVMHVFLDINHCKGYCSGNPDVWHCQTVPYLVYETVL